MRDKLTDFLDAKNLDILQLTKDKLGELQETDIVQFRSILQKWEPSLALSNILFTPSILPPDLQNMAILRGICDRQNQYNVLAATVGLQELSPQNFSAAEREIIIHSLLDIIERHPNVLADRASVSVLPFLEKTEIGKVTILLCNVSETVRHNLLGWLYQTVAHSSYAKLKEILDQEKVPPESRKKIEKELERDEHGVNNGLPSLLASPLYSYIPVRNEMWV